MQETVSDSSEAEHHRHPHALVAGNVLNGLPQKQKPFQHLLQLRIIDQLIVHGFKQRVLFHEKHPHRCQETVLRPGGFLCGKAFTSGDFFIHQLAQARYQKGVAGGIGAQQIRHPGNVHSRMGIALILLQHPRNVRRGKAHIYLEVRRYVPWTIRFPRILRPDFRL